MNNLNEAKFDSIALNQIYIFCILIFFLFSLYRSYNPLEVFGASAQFKAVLFPNNGFHSYNSHKCKCTERKIYLCMSSMKRNRYSTRSNNFHDVDLAVSKYHLITLIL